MADKQIQVRNRDYQITPRTRPRGITGQVWTVVLQPVYFFRTMPLMADTRSWLWAAILVLTVSGVSAVRQEILLNEASGVTAVDMGGVPPGVDVGIPGGGGAFEVIPGGGGDIPSDVGVPPAAPTTGGEADVTSTWTTALLTASSIILGWLVLSILLSEVSLFNGRAPMIGQNLQIAIWASIPLGLMAVLQLVFYAAGGEVGATGVSGVLAEWEAYKSMSPLVQSLILSFTSRLTLFWLWSLILIYVGARNTLQGKWFASAIVVVAWMLLLVVMPVVTGTIKAPEAAAENVIPGDPSFSPDGEIPSGLTDPFGQPVDGNMIETTPEASSEGGLNTQASGDSSEADVTPEVQSQTGGNAEEATAEVQPESSSEGQFSTQTGGVIEPTAPPSVNRPGGG
jgi:hypothetical protein